MPVEISAIPSGASIQEGIARIEFDTSAPSPLDYTMKAYFASDLYAADGTLIGGQYRFNSRVVERRFGDIETDTQTVTVGGVAVTASAAHVQALIKAFIYAYRTADMTPPSPPAP